jgi:ferredoxin
MCSRILKTLRDGAIELMVKATRKPLNEILECVRHHRRILNVGCGGCVSVCLVGGHKEVQILCTELNLNLGLEKNPARIAGYTVERQCNPLLLAELDDVSADYDAFLSMACGAGAQLLAERYPDKPVYPAVNTVAIGIDRDVGLYEERCRACGECVLGYTGGICPVTRCAKSLFNGPCGGTHDGLCEISEADEIPCAWHQIYHRLQAQGRLDRILNIQAVMSWQTTPCRPIIQEPYRERYYRHSEK